MDADAAAGIAVAGETFALETTLATRHYLSFIEEAQAHDYSVHLLFFWLSSVEAAVQRVRVRVQEGGHNIPEDVMQRRYELGLRAIWLPLIVGRL